MITMYVLITVFVIVVLWNLSEKDKANKIPNEKPKPHGLTWDDVQWMGDAGYTHIPLPTMIRNGQPTPAAFVILPGKGCYMSIQTEDERWHEVARWIGHGAPSFKDGNSIVPSIKAQWEKLADK